MSKPKLHELLAVESDLEGNSKLVIDEAIVTFSKKPDHFEKFVRKYEPSVEGEPDQPTEYKEITTTVGQKLMTETIKRVRIW